VQVAQDADFARRLQDPPEAMHQQTRVQPQGDDAPEVSRRCNTSITISLQVVQGQPAQGS
jgi:hypothetical protein